MASCKSCQNNRVPAKKKPIPMEGYKFCSLCKIELPRTSYFFHRKTNEKDGFNCQCKKCVGQYYVLNKDRIDQQQSDYRIKNREKIKRYFHKNKELLNKKALKYYQENSVFLLNNKKIQSRSLYAFNGVHTERLSKYEKVHKNQKGLLEVCCAYCGRRFVPTYDQVIRRLRSCEADYVHGSNRFYCNNSRDGDG